jgi:hypothetical protein
MIRSALAVETPPSGWRRILMSPTDGRAAGKGERVGEPVPLPPTVADWVPFELARSYDRWLQAHGVDYLDLEEGGELERRLRAEWLHRKGGEVDRLRSEWLRGGNRSPDSTKRGA